MDNTLQTKVFIVPFFTQSILKRRLDRVYDHFSLNLANSGCAVLYRREVINSIGEFDEDFWADWEDYDLGHRINLAGFRSVYVPAPLVLHVGSGSGFPPERHVRIYRNMLFTYVKNYEQRNLITRFPFFMFILLPLWHVGYVIHRLCFLTRDFDRSKGFWYLVSIVKAYIQFITKLKTIVAKRYKVQNLRKISDEHIFSTRLLRCVKQSVLYQFFFYNYNNIIISKLARDIKSLMDAGCGLGARMECIKRHRKDIYSVGVDLFILYLKSAKKRKVYDDYVLTDVRHLPFRKKSFDVVLCTELIEHLAKDEAMAVLVDFEEISKKQLIIGTPVGYLKELPPLLTRLISMSKKENPLIGHPADDTKAHLSGYRPAEFRKMAYRVFGAEGFRLLYYTSSFLGLVAAYFTGPLAYFWPEIAHQMICVRNLEASQRHFLSHFE